jgi:23S rRNA G2445 N2-methylase RlmL
MVRDVAERAYALCPEILNDARQAPWAIDVHPTPHGDSVELRPRLARDPRQFYRTDDVPAASHPPLAACMARLAGSAEEEVVWDPFCRSGLELIERALLGGVRRVHGTDRDPRAIAISRANFAAVQVPGVEARFTCCDFREFAQTAGIEPGSVSLVISNPPLGRRLRIPNLRGLFVDLFRAAATVLRPGGRLVVTNPFRMDDVPPGLRLESRQMVDLGGFDCRLELYRRTASPLGKAQRKRGDDRTASGAGG